MTFPSVAPVRTMSCQCCCCVNVPQPVWEVFIDSAVATSDSTNPTACENSYSAGKCCFRSDVPLVRARARRRHERRSDGSCSSEARVALRGVRHVSAAQVGNDSRDERGIDWARFSHYHEESLRFMFQSKEQCVSGEKQLTDARGSLCDVGTR